MKDAAIEKNATEVAKLIMLALEGDLSVLEKLLNGTDPFAPAPKRMLAEEDTVLVEVDEATDTTGLAAGEDNNLDDTELTDVDVEISQDAPTEATEALDAVNVEEDTQIGDDSNSDDIDPTDSGSSGSGFMKWVMYIGGAILLLALIGGIGYVVMQ